MYLITLLSVIVHGGYMGSRMVMSLFALELGAGPFAIGLLVSMYSALSLMLAVYSGKISDRAGVRLPMLTGSLGMLVALALPGLLPGLGILYVSAALTGAAFILFNVSVQNLTGVYGPPERRTRNFSMLSLGFSISSFAGPMSAGYAIEYAGYQATFLFFAGPMLLPALVLALYRPLTAVAPPRSTPRAQNSLDLIRDPKLRQMFITSGLGVTGWDLFTFYLPIYAHSIGLAASSIGMLFGAFAVATLITRFALPRLVERYTGPRVLACAMLAGAVMFVPFPFVHNVYLLYAIAFAIGLALGCGQPLTMMLAYERAPRGRAGEVTGLRLAVNHLTHFLVPLLAGATGAAFGMTPVFWANALFLAASAWLNRK